MPADVREAHGALALSGMSPMSRGSSEGASEPPPRDPPKPLMRTLVVRFVEVNRLADIDIIGQRFRAECFLQFAFEGGALDDDLCRPGADFPVDEWGRPTYRPSAEWYVAQFDFNNAHEYKLLDAKVVADDDDLLINMRFEGCFSELMELEKFPFDAQELTMSASFNLRTKGMTPLQIRNSPTALTTIAPNAFVDGKMWTLHPALELTPGEYGVVDERKFPALKMTILVGRNPQFYLWNVALPVCLFVPMCLMQYCVPRDYTAERLGVSLAIVLTAIAHKYSMTTLVPSVNYLTFLDLYVLLSLGLISLITFQGGLVGISEVLYCRTQAVYARDLDGAFGLDLNQTGGDQGRRLVGTTSGTSASSNVASNSASGVRANPNLPLYYDDINCPYTKMGPFNRFDAIDYGCLLVDMVLWIWLQVWALRYYLRVCHDLEKRVEEINLHMDFEDGAAPRSPNGKKRRSVLGELPPKEAARRSAHPHLPGALDRQRSRIAYIKNRFTPNLRSRLTKTKTKKSETTETVAWEVSASPANETDVPEPRFLPA